MTPNIGKKLLIQELNLNFFVREFETVTTTAIVEMPLWREQGLDSQWGFHSKSFEISFFFSGLPNYFQRIATHRNNKSSLAWK